MNNAAEPAAMLHAAALSAALACLAAAVVNDLRRYLIPNRWPLLIALLFLPAALSGGLDGVGWLTHLGVAVAVFAGGAVLFHFGGMGGGDVKLLSALALWTGPAGLAPLLVGTALGGGLLALVMLAIRRLRRPPPPIPGAPPAPAAPPLRLPYAVAIAAGGALVLLAPARGSGNLLSYFANHP